MLPLAHLGIGTATGRLLIGRTPALWLILGIVLPDLIDKPILLFKYGELSVVTKIHGAMIGHSIALLAFVYFFSFLQESAELISIAIGMSTHLILDALDPMVDLTYQAHARLAENVWWSTGLSCAQLSDGLHGPCDLFFEGIGLALLIAQFLVYSLGKTARR